LVARYSRKTANSLLKTRNACDRLETRLSKKHQASATAATECHESRPPRAADSRLERLDLPEPWQSNVSVSLALIDHLDEEVASLERDLRQIGNEHPYLPLLMSVPGIGCVLGFTIASEIGTIERRSQPLEARHLGGVLVTICSRFA
jgi:transposase